MPLTGQFMSFIASMVIKQWATSARTWAKDVSIWSPSASLMPETGAAPSASALLPPGPGRKAEPLPVLNDLFAEGFSWSEEMWMLPLL